MANKKSRNHFFGDVRTVLFCPVAGRRPPSRDIIQPPFDTKMVVAAATPSCQIWRAVLAPALAHPKRTHRLGHPACPVRRGRSIPPGGSRKLVITLKSDDVHHDAIPSIGRPRSPSSYKTTLANAEPPVPSSNHPGPSPVRLPIVSPVRFGKKNHLNTFASR